MAGATPRMHEFGSRQNLAGALASTVAERLSQAIATQGSASLAVSGGTTPALFFATLSDQDIDWSRVTVTLVDERFVEPSSPRSNEGLVRRTLLTGKAAAAHFIPLYREAASAEDARAHSEQALSTLGLPLDVVVLGMGGDGHTASFFPDATRLAELLDPSNTALIATVEAPSAGETRLTMTLPTIASALYLALHIEGDEKRRVISDVLAGKASPPISAVLSAAQSDVQIYWAP
jgi:6-phosphogluconolactonase